MPPVEIGIIGLGFGERVLLSAFHQCDHARVIAVCSSSLAHAQDVARRFDIPFAFSYFEDLLALNTLGLVVVATPPYLHYQMVMRALERKLNVLCEKPMALNTRQAQAMYDQANQNRVFHFVNHQLRFDPNRAQLKTLVAEGYIGTIRHISANYVTDYRALPSLRWNWWCEESKGGGLLAASGSHIVDWLLWTFGKINDVLAVRASFTKVLPTGQDGELLPVETEDYVSLLLTFCDSSQATVTLSAAAPYPTGMQVQIYGTRGVLSLDAKGNLWGCREGESAFQNLSVVPGSGAEVWIDAFRQYVVLLTDALERGEPLENAATFEDGLRCQKVLDAARLSWKEGCRVPVAD